MTHAQIALGLTIIYSSGTIHDVPRTDSVGVAWEAGF